MCELVAPQRARSQHRQTPRRSPDGARETMGLHRFAHVNASRITAPSTRAVRGAPVGVARRCTVATTTGRGLPRALWGTYIALRVARTLARVYTHGFLFRIESSFYIHIAALLTYPASREPESAETTRQRITQHSVTPSARGVPLHDRTVRGALKHSARHAALAIAALSLGV